jgi:hypothetical protein
VIKGTKDDCSRRERNSNPRWLASPRSQIVPPIVLVLELELVLEICQFGAVYWFTKDGSFRKPYHFDAWSNEISNGSYRTLRDGFLGGRFPRHFVPGYDHAVPLGRNTRNLMRWTGRDPALIK